MFVRCARRGCVRVVSRTLGICLNSISSNRSIILSTVGCDTRNKKGEVEPMLALRFYHIYNKSIRETVPFTYTMRVVRACSLVRSSLPYVSGSSVEHNGPSYRGTFNRRCTLLTNSKLLALTFRALSGTRSVGISAFGRTLFALSGLTNVGNVINNRILSLGTRGDGPALSTLRAVSHLGANTLVGTTYALNYLTSRGCSKRGVTTTSICTRGVKLTFRVMSSVLSIADSATALNGPINDSSGGRGVACIGLVNVRGSRRAISRLAGRTMGTLKIFSNSASFLRGLTCGLTLEGGWPIFKKDFFGRMS